MISTIIIFIAILALLVLVHEFGHFIVAKKSGMTVEEFGFGFPPRVLGIQKINGNWKIVWGTRKPTSESMPAEMLSPALQNKAEPNSTIYSINLIPLGGFVRILGENNEDENNEGSFINKSFTKRFLTLVAGVIMNVLLAWAIFSVGYMVGLPVAVDSASNIPANTTFTNPQIAILDVVSGLPADKAGVKPNDIILSIDGQRFSDVTGVQNYVKGHTSKELDFLIKRGPPQLDLKVTPNSNPPAGQGPTGVGLALVGRLKYPWYSAVWQGLKSAISGIGQIFKGLYQLFATHAGFSSLGGPVKIAKLTGEVAGLGFVYLLQFTAFLSLNLAALNILPFPALDGGRVLFLVIEKIRGKRNNQKVEQIVNTAGFIFLLLLMVAVTFQDIFRK
jgi:regulator of sigma E protease